MSDPREELHRMMNTCFSCERYFFDEGVPACSMCMCPPKYPMEAPAGQIFVCGACGKRSKTMFNSIDDPTGWDESCMFNCVLVYEDTLNVVPGYEPTPRKGRNFDEPRSPEFEKALDDAVKRCFPPEDSDNV